VTVTRAMKSVYLTFGCNFFFLHLISTIIYHSCFKVFTFTGETWPLYMVLTDRSLPEIWKFILVSHSTYSDTESVLFSDVLFCICNQSRFTFLHLALFILIILSMQFCVRIIRITCWYYLFNIILWCILSLKAWICLP